MSTLAVEIYQKKEEVMLCFRHFVPHIFHTHVGTPLSGESQMDPFAQMFVNYLGYQFESLC